MIRVTKLSKPQVLVSNEASWNSEYMSYINANETPPDSVKGKYRHQEIRTQIELETHNKCVYCESKIKPASFGDVEHILPKAKYPRYIFLWENLTLACEVCNRKHKKDHDNPPLVNPYSDTPSDHLVPDGPMVLPISNDVCGNTTVFVLKLNREELLLKRAERLSALLPLIEKWDSETNDVYKQILQQQLELEAGSGSEYSMVVSEFLRRRGVL